VHGGDEVLALELNVSEGEVYACVRACCVCRERVLPICLRRSSHYLLYVVKICSKDMQ